MEVLWCMEDFFGVVQNTLVLVVFVCFNLES